MRYCEGTICFTLSLGGACDVVSNGLLFFFSFPPSFFLQMKPIPFRVRAAPLPRPRSDRATRPPKLKTLDLLNIIIINYVRNFVSVLFVSVTVTVFCVVVRPLPASRRHIPARPSCAASASSSSSSFVVVVAVGSICDCWRDASTNKKKSHTQQQKNHKKNFFHP